MTSILASNQKYSKPNYNKMFASKQNSLIKAIRGIGSSDLSKRQRDSDSNFETFLNIKRKKDLN